MDIKSVIQSHGLKVQDVASRMEIKQSTLSGLFTGNPTVETLHKIAKAVGCSVAEFFYDELPAGTQPPSPANELPFDGHQETAAPSPMAQQALICPHCHEAIKIVAV